jgi:hypothetical protein
MTDARLVQLPQRKSPGILSVLKLNVNPTVNPARPRRRCSPDNEAKDFRARWTEIQTAFVDEPRRAVEQADALVAEVIQRLANSFSQARSTLEGQWGRGDNVSTEDLRVTLQRYRAFFDRLLNV